MEGSIWSEEKQRCLAPPCLKTYSIQPIYMYGEHVIVDECHNNVIPTKGLFIFNTSLSLKRKISAKYSLKEITDYRTEHV